MKIKAVSLFMLLLFLSVFISFGQTNNAQDRTIARHWIEATLHGVRNDFARPTIHARNLFHVSIAMYDTWALFDSKAQPYLIGNTLGDFQSDFSIASLDKSIDKEEVLSHAVYRLLTFRFAKSPNQAVTQHYFDSLMNHFNYSTRNISIDYADGSASSLGNFIASEIIRFGLMDRSNEQGEYENLYYHPINAPLLLTENDPIQLVDPNRWQPLTFETFVDQSGNLIAGTTPKFLSPEWGNVSGFALTSKSKTTYTRDGDTYIVYHDPGTPPKITNEDSQEAYKWGFDLVSQWGAQLDATDNIMWDISPKRIGNVAEYPESLEEYKAFYLPDGGTLQAGHSVNPITGLPYESQIVPRGDYARVLAEFWADGPDSETPPGHWFAIIDYVMDHPLFEAKFMGTEVFEERIEYDVKTYFALGAAMHDVAISSWSIKGWYDYIRPISAIRYMGTMGQSSDETLDNYHPHGIPLLDGYAEIVKEGDPLAENPENIGKIKLFSWKGHDYIENPEVDVAGVGWILAENWWPYQRPTFVTPPFAGYISGHSTYSSAAAEVLTQITGTAYFPGGMGEFHAPKDEFLVFEKGPSVDVTLQWATYKDAADQCSLSRIWGGIHPPADDIPGRKIGPIVAKEVLAKAMKYFEGEALLYSNSSKSNNWSIYPNPVKHGHQLNLQGDHIIDAHLIIYDAQGKKHYEKTITNRNSFQLDIDLPKGLYFFQTIRSNERSAIKVLVE